MNKYLIHALVWTGIALLAFYVLFFMSDANLLARLSGTVLIGMCLVGQWMRYIKLK